MVKFGSFSLDPLQYCSQIALVVSCSVVATLFRLWPKNVHQAILLLDQVGAQQVRENFQMSCRSLKRKLCTLREPCIPIMTHNECVLQCHWKCKYVLQNGWKIPFAPYTSHIAEVENTK